VATELLDDRAYRAVPLTDVDAAELISAPRAAPLLTGYRGTRVVAREPLIDLALRLSTLADDLPEVSDLQLRPVLAGPRSCIRRYVLITPFGALSKARSMSWTMRKSAGR